MQNDQALAAAKSEIEFLIQEVISAYQNARDEGEIGQLHDENWDKRNNNEVDYFFAEDSTEYMDIFLAGYAISIVNSNDRDWHRIYKEILERDFLKTEGLFEWMTEGVIRYPRISYQIICIAHLRYKVLQFIEKHLLDCK